jgi:hypothetical protein
VSDTAYSRSMRSPGLVAVAVGGRWAWPDVGTVVGTGTRLAARRWINAGR